MTEDQLSKIIVDTCYHIHTKMGPGLFENVYKTILAHQLKKRGLKVEVEKNISIVFEDLEFTNAYRVDIMVEGKLIIEVKSVNTTIELHRAQVLNYLRLSGCKLGLLINFNEVLIRNGIKRVVNGL